ncbi:hypothetical protein ACFQDG_09780 [Natronoarchaeum mannanilyticum]|uniref:Uncharacterized protein n=1 Tax=Natronoarchaeum mannanilyticum TaxID=926360 RepID=A0AAV3TAW2_9EURY
MTDRTSVGDRLKRLILHSTGAAVSALSALPVVSAAGAAGGDTVGGPELNWKCSLAADDAEVCDVAAAGDGGYVAVGAATDGQDAWIANINAGGTVEWSSHVACGDGTDVARSVAPVVGGGYAFAGTSTSTDESDVFLVGTDQNGTRQWTRTFGGSAFDFCRALVQTRDGGFAIAGSTQSNADEGQDMWLLKTDAEGRFEWVRTYNRSSSDALGDVVVTGDGGYGIVGSTFGDGTDCWVARADADGAIAWERTLSRSDVDVARSIVQTDDGGFAIAGHTIIGDDRRKDAWLAKLNAGGTVEWQRTYGEGTDDLAVELVRTDDGGYALLGTTITAGRERTLLVTTDAAGRREWLRTLSDSGSVRAGLADATPGTYVLAGTESGGRGGRDADGWVARYSAPVDGSGP